MELRNYWQIITRYWLLVVALTLVGLVASFQYYTSNRPTWQAVAIMNVTAQPSSNDPYSGIYANQSSDYITDEFKKIIPGTRFLSEVADGLKEGGLNLSADDLKGMVSVDRLNRTLTITTSSNDKDLAVQVAKTTATTLENKAVDFVKPRQVSVTTIDLPSQASLSGGRTFLLAAVRVLAGLLAGVGLAFLLAYLDNTIKTKTEAEELLGLPVLGLVPTSRTRTPAVGLPSAPGPARPTDADYEQIIQARLNAIQTSPGPDKERVSSR